MSQPWGAATLKRWLALLPVSPPCEWHIHPHFLSGRMQSCVLGNRAELLFLASKGIGRFLELKKKKS